MEIEYIDIDAGPELTFSIEDSSPTFVLSSSDLDPLPASITIQNNLNQTSSI